MFHLAEPECPDLKIKLFRKLRKSGITLNIIPFNCSLWNVMYSFTGFQLFNTEIWINYLQGLNMTSIHHQDTKVLFWLFSTIIEASVVIFSFHLQRLCWRHWEWWFVYRFWELLSLVADNCDGHRVPQCSMGTVVWGFKVIL